MEEDVVDPVAFLTQNIFDDGDAAVAENADTLSDKELREKLNRLQMEQNLRDLSNKNMSSGERFVKSMGNQIAKTAVTTLVVTPLILAAKKHLENAGFYNFGM